MEIGRLSSRCMAGQDLQGGYSGKIDLTLQISSPFAGSAQAAHPQDCRDLGVLGIPAYSCVIETGRFGL